MSQVASLVPHPAGRFLAFDTSTDRMSVAVSCGPQVWQHEGPGAAQSSATLIPAILQLMAEAGMRLSELDAIAFGRGPGSFTGLRTACAVAQGLALGAGVRVLPIDTLMALAEEARHAQALQAAPFEFTHITALLDARMDEMYVQRFEVTEGRFTALSPCALVRPEALELQVSSSRHLLAGNVFEVYAGRLPAFPLGCTPVQALPAAAAMLRLAPGLMARGLAVPAAQALPLYVRDKVALTTDERAEVKAHAAAAALASTV